MQLSLDHAFAHIRMLSMIVQDDEETCASGLMQR